MNASQWAALKKQPDKAKKMLSALHMSPAYLKVLWGELDGGDQRKVSNWITKNGSGWFEKSEPTYTTKGIKSVAPKHRKAAVKKESEGVLRKPMKKEKTVHTEPKKSQKVSLEELVKEYKEIGKEMKVHGITQRGRPEADVLISRENQLWDGIRDIYLERLERIPESKKIKPDGLGVLALAGRATTKAVQESPSKVNLEEMVSEWLNPHPINKGEEQAYKNYGLVWDGNTSRQDVTSIDYYRVEPNPPKDVSYQGSKSFHGDSAALYYSKSNKETYILPRDSKEYLIHLRNEKVEQDSWSARAKKAGIDLEGLYIDDTDGIRFRMLDGAFKGKTAFRCPEDYRGLVFNSESKLSCGEHGSLTSPDKAIDLRKIGIDDKTTKWAEQQFKSWLSEAKLEGFKTVAEYVDSLKVKDGDKGYAKYAELGRGLEQTFITVAPRVSREIDEELAAEKKKSEPDKSGTLIYLEKAYKERLEAMDTSPIPLSNPEAEEITDAIEFAKTSRVPILMHFDKVDVQMRYWKDTAGNITGIEIVVFNESQNPVYHNRDYDMNLTASEIFRIRDAETNKIIESEKEERKKKEEEEEKRKNKFNKTTLSLYNKTYPMAMDYFLYSIVTLPPTVGVDNMTEEWLEKINKYVAEAGDNKYSVEWFKERNEYLVKEEWEKTTKKEPEKPAKQSYFRVIQVDGKTKKDPVRAANPFTYKGVEFFSHKEGRVWHASEATTGLRFADGNTQVQAEDAAIAIIDRAGSDVIQGQIATAKQNLEKILRTN